MVHYLDLSYKKYFLYNCLQKTKCIHSFWKELLSNEIHNNWLSDCKLAENIVKSNYTYETNRDRKNSFGIIDRYHDANRLRDLILYLKS